MVECKDIYSNSPLIEVVFNRQLKPIPIRMCFNEGLFFAQNETLLLYGTGKTPDEAIEDLGAHIIHFYQYYKDLDRLKITGDAIRSKGIYEGLLLEQRCRLTGVKLSLHWLERDL